MTNHDKKADICLVLEGTYPYITGGVSNWTHDLISSHSDLTFHIVALLPPDSEAKAKFTIPSNVLSITNIFLQKIEYSGKKLANKEIRNLFEELEELLLNLHSADVKIESFEKIYHLLNKYKDGLNRKILLDSEPAWQMLLNMYNITMDDTSFIDYFWTWRALLGCLYSVMLAKVPKASVYHALCTGYAGLYLAKAKFETGKPAILTEHGIYTNERRIEIASAEWLEDQKSLNLSINKASDNRDLKDFWSDSFSAYSKLCYSACDSIITLFEGNHNFQLIDGAEDSKLSVIANGVDLERFTKINKKQGGVFTIALIGRVVPVKDIKSFINACDILRESITDFKAYIAGPTDEDEAYYSECVSMVDRLGLKNIVTFVGKVKIDEFLSQIDLLVLTSLSESQPLVILEAGALGIPSVVTDVGACYEMINGKDTEEPRLGSGGAVCQLSNPSAIAGEILMMIKNKSYYETCSDSIKKRVAKYYDKKMQHSAYDSLYKGYIKLQNSSNKEAS